MPVEKEIVVITGGCGFLGQHLVREIQLLWSTNKVKQIRVVDKKIFEKFLDYPDNIPVIECIADCAVEQELVPYFQGATIIFHMAARPYHFDMYPNKKGYYRDNFEATKAVVAAALHCNVPYLVYTSDAMALMNEDDSQGMSELSTGNGPANGFYILDSYGKTKCLAQRFVRESNGKLGENGQPLYTVVVSPTALYGEGDNWIVPHALRLCKQYGYLQRFGDGVSVVSMTYAGNAAYMHLLTAQKLRENPQEFGSEVFLCSEFTRPENYFKFIEPFLTQSGYKLSKFSVPFLTAWFLIFLIEMFFYFFYFVFGVKFPHNFPNSRLVRLVSAYYYHFNCSKARLVLDYKPKYEPKEARQITLDWWKKNYKNYL